MLSAPVQIPPERVPPIAKEVASTRKMWASVCWFVGAVMVAGAVGTQADASLGRGSLLAGAAFWVVVLGGFGLRWYRQARRASEAANRATGGAATWMLSGRDLIAYDRAGVPQPDASFRLSTTQAAMLTALPKAELRQ